MSTSEVVDPGPSGGSAGYSPECPSDDHDMSDSAIDDAPGPVISEARPNTTKKGQYFGMPKNRAAPVYLRPDDYEQKYPPDEIEEALGPNARVWRVYLDEAQAFDSNMIEGWKDTIDVLLVFAGLFSAVVTTFVVQTSQSLQPDYSEISALVLSELVGLQRAIADGKPAGSVPPSFQNATTAATFVAQKSDQWINGLWFTSLALSLATALMSVLVKQWLQYYMMPVSGTSQEQVHVRQFRYTSMKLWHVGGIIGCLPVLMHLALMLFYIGLVVLVVQLDIAIATVVAVIAGLVYIAYFATNMWAIINVQCPYKTPLSDFSRLLLGIIGLKIYNMLPKFQKILISIYKHGHNMHKLVSEVSSKEEVSKKNGGLFTERNMIHNIAGALDIDALIWLSKISSNTSITRIICHSLAALDLDKHNAKNLISQPIIRYFHSENHYGDFVNDSKPLYEVFSIFWANAMIFTTYWKYTQGLNMVTPGRNYFIDSHKNKEYKIYDNLDELIFHGPQKYQNLNLTIYNIIFECMTELPASEHWLWRRALHFITHFILAENRSPSQLIQVILLYFKFGFAVSPETLSSEKQLIMERLHFILIHSFAWSKKPMTIGPTTFDAPILQYQNEVLSEIFNACFDNINKWINDVSEIDIDLLIDYWSNYWSFLTQTRDTYLEQSIKMLNCGKIYNKLQQPKLENLIQRSAFYLMHNSEKNKPISISLNESFLFAFSEKENYVYNIKYYVSCLELLNNTTNFSFWYKHGIMAIIPCIPLDESLWEPTRKFVSHLYNEVLYKPSDQFLNWYCALYLNTYKDYIIDNSKFLELIEHSLERSIWTTFLASIIEKYNKAILWKSRYLDMFDGDTRTLYFQQLLYLSQMKKKLSISSTDTRFILYAYVGGKDIELLRHLNSAQHVPCSIVFESKHFENKKKMSHSPTSRYQSNLIFKAIQECFQIGGASNQVDDVELQEV